MTREFLTLLSKRGRGNLTYIEWAIKRGALKSIKADSRPVSTMVKDSPPRDVCYERFHWIASTIQSPAPSTYTLHKPWSPTPHKNTHSRLPPLKGGSGGNSDFFYNKCEHPHTTNWWKQENRSRKYDNYTNKASRKKHVHSKNKWFWNNMSLDWEILPSPIVVLGRAILKSTGLAQQTHIVPHQCILRNVLQCTRTPARFIATSSFKYWKRCNLAWTRVSLYSTSNT